MDEDIVLDCRIPTAVVQPTAACGFNIGTASVIVTEGVVLDQRAACVVV